MRTLFLVSLLCISSYVCSQTVEIDLFGNIQINNTINDDCDGQKKVIKKDIFGNVVIEENNGKKVTVIKKDIFGNTIVEDGSGRTINVFN